MKLHNLNDVLIPRPRVQYYIENMIRPSTVNMFYGESGLGKTLILSSQGICLATGESWLGFQTMKSNVLFIQEEMGDEGFYDFLELVYRGYHKKPVKEIGFDFTIMEGVNFDNGGKWFEKVSQMITRLNKNIVYLDPFAALMSGDENTKKDIQPVMEILRKLTKLPTKPAIILLHHPNRGQEGSYRGSGAIKGNLDLLVKISKKSEDCVTFTMEKNRYRPNVIWSARKFFENNTYRLERLSEALDDNAKSKLMITVIENNPKLGMEGLEKAYANSGGKKSDARTIITKLLTDECIEPVTNSENGGRGKKKTFKVTDSYIYTQMAESVENVVNSYR